MTDRDASGPQRIIIRDFEFESGAQFAEVPVAFQTWGRLASSGDNAVVVCHALTGNADVASWWSQMLGPGRALDPVRDFVFCANVLASPYGTLSPLTINPDSGQAYGADFPVPTIRDTVSLHRQVLEALGVKRVRFATGGSMGGMQALEWGRHRDYVDALVPIAVGGRHSAWCIAWSEAQRRAIRSDPLWLDGKYSAAAPPRGGLALARMIAMISYRSFRSFDERFGRAPADRAGQWSFAMESYLDYQGGKLVDRFDANCYVRLTESMDTHDVARGHRAYHETLAQITQPALVVGIDSDVLYPLSEQRELADYMPGAELAVLAARHGHDSFLIEVNPLNELVVDWRRRSVDL